MNIQRLIGTADKPLRTGRCGGYGTNSSKGALVRSRSSTSATLSPVDMLSLQPGGRRTPVGTSSHRLGGIAFAAEEILRSFLKGYCGTIAEHNIISKRDGWGFWRISRENTGFYALSETEKRPKRRRLSMGELRLQGRSWRIIMLHKSIYCNLLFQFNRLASHNRQGSCKTKARYAEAFKRFLVFLADAFRLEKLANIAPKHLFAYVDDLTKRGLSAAYIKTELSAIRFFHDQIPNAKHQLPDNTALDLQRRQFGGVDRTWSDVEYNRFVAKAIQLGRNDYAAVLCLGRYAALRIHECFRLDTATVEKALRTGGLTVKGKGGLVRDVPINYPIPVALKDMHALTPRGHKLFVAPNDKTHLAIHRLVAFIHYHKAELQDADSTRPMTFHGLRHTCAAEWYDGLIQQGYSELDARKKVSNLLGHNRDDVTRIYLASLLWPESTSEYRTNIIE